MKSNIISILIFLVGLSTSYLASVYFTHKEIDKHNQEMQIISKTISFNIRYSIENDAEKIQLLVRHWQSINELNRHWEGDTQILKRQNKFITKIKLFPVIEETAFNLPNNALIRADNDIQRHSQLRARNNLPMESSKVIPSFIYTNQVDYRNEYMVELALQFPVVMDNILVAYVEVSIDLANFLRNKLDTYQITNPFSLSENGLTLFSTLPEKISEDNITQKIMLPFYGHDWILLISSELPQPNKNLYLLLSLLVSFLLAVTVKLLMLNHALQKQNKFNHNKIKHIDSEYRNNQAKLIQSNKLASLGEMASGIAHEINQPLQIICIHTDLCVQNLTIGNYNLVEKSFKAIIEQSERIEKIVKQVGSFGRDSELDAYQKEDPNNIFNNVIDIVLSQYNQDNVELRQIIHRPLPLLFCNKTQIEQVLINILINARDAVETCEEKTVFLKAHVQGENLYIQVSDSGIGIDPHKINNIFTPFYTTKPIGKGTGLGLSISYSIIAQHKGKIEVTSEIGKGSVFTVIIPIEKYTNQRV
ncbi:sensor histidine kinase [Psychromonas aquatilis]|uniref:histidine kinase n=1 Tax=Psychromonas aquatilis TaxID=2005072 RepID=A0ABU9GST1_9GAMM